MEGLMEHGKSVERDRKLMAAVLGHCSTSTSPLPSMKHYPLWMDPLVLVLTL